MKIYTVTVSRAYSTALLFRYSFKEKPKVFKTIIDVIEKDPAFNRTEKLNTERNRDVEFFRTKDDLIERLLESTETLRSIRGDRSNYQYPVFDQVELDITEVEIH